MKDSILRLSEPILTFQSLLEDHKLVYPAIRVVRQVLPPPTIDPEHLQPAPRRLDNLNHHCKPAVSSDVIQRLLRFAMEHIEDLDSKVVERRRKDSKVVERRRKDSIRLPPFDRKTAWRELASLAYGLGVQTCVVDDPRASSPIESISHNPDPAEIAAAKVEEMSPADRTGRPTLTTWRGFYVLRGETERPPHLGDTVNTRPAGLSVFTPVDTRHFQVAAFLGHCGGPSCLYRDEVSIDEIYDSYAETTPPERRLLSGHAHDTTTIRRPTVPLSEEPPSPLTICDVDTDWTSVGNRHARSSSSAYSSSNDVTHTLHGPESYREVVGTPPFSDLEDCHDGFDDFEGVLQDISSPNLAPKDPSVAVRARNVERKTANVDFQLPQQRAKRSVVGKHLRDGLTDDDSSASDSSRSYSATDAADGYRVFLVEKRRLKSLGFRRTSEVEQRIKDSRGGLIIHDEDFRTRTGSYVRPGVSRTRTGSTTQSKPRRAPYIVLSERGDDAFAVGNVDEQALRDARKRALRRRSAKRQQESPRRIRF